MLLGDTDCCDTLMSRYMVFVMSVPIVSSMRQFRDQMLHLLLNTLLCKQVI
jgi:hypothetical protein